MKKEQSTKISKSSIIFYVIAVIFLCIAAFQIYMTHQSVISYTDAYGAGTLATKDMVSAYLTGCSPYFAFAFILYGVGVILGKITMMTTALTQCMEEAIDTPQEDSVEQEKEALVQEESVEQESVVEETVEEELTDTKEA